jgi:hypothetical protein
MLWKTREFSMPHAGTRYDSPAIEAECGDTRQGPLTTPGRILAIVSLVVYVLLLAILSQLDHSWVYDSPILLFCLNTTFLALLPFAILYVVTTSYLMSGSISLILLGGGVLSWGFGSLLAALVLPHGGPNSVVTLHNSCALISAALHFLGSGLGFLGMFPQSDLQRRRVIVSRIENRG